MKKTQALPLFAIFVVGAACTSIPVEPTATVTSIPPTSTQTAIPPTPIPPTPTPIPTFSDAVGSWEGTDVDGSHMTLQIIQTGENTVDFIFVDEGASVCGKDEDGNPLYAMDIIASGDTTELAINLTDAIGTCRVVDKVITFDYSFTYLPDSDTLVDVLGVVWTRE